MGNKVLSTVEAIQAGMAPVLDERMENEESRFRRMHSDGSGYIRTESVAGGWQNAHRHSHLREWYAVEKGRMAMVWTEAETLRVQIIGPGGQFTTHPGVAHNVYLWPGTTTHTVKFLVEADPQDWIAEPALDAASKALTLQELERLAAG